MSNIVLDNGQGIVTKSSNGRKGIPVDARTQVQYYKDIQNIEYAYENLQVIVTDNDPTDLQHPKGIYIITKLDGDNVDPTGIKSLKETVNVTKQDVGLENVDNVKQVPQTRTINNKPLSSNVTLNANDVSAIDINQKGANGGVAELDNNGKLKSAQIPTIVATTDGLNQKVDKISNAEGNLPKINSSGNLENSGFSIPTTENSDQILGYDSTLPGKLKWINKPVDGQNGDSAYQTWLDINQHQSTDPGYSETDFLNSLKAHIGKFQYEDTDNDVVSSVTNIGDPVSSINSLIPGDGNNGTNNTLDVIVLMNNGDTTTPKTMMFSTSGDSTNGYRFYYAGDLQSAMPSNVLTQNNIVNDFNGGTTNVASAETVKTLNEGKIGKQITETTTSYQDVAVELGYPKQTVITATGDEYTDGSVVCKIIKCAVSPAKKYRLEGKTSSNTKPIYYFYDAEDVAISGDYPQGTDYTTFNNIIPPSNAAYIRLTGGISSGQPVCQEIVTTTTIIKDNQAIIDSVGNISELDTTEKSTVVGAINELANVISGIGDMSGAVQKINAISDTVVSQNMFNKSAMIDGYIQASNGSTTSIAAYKMSDYISVLPNHYYYLSGRTSSKVIRCLNADKSEVMQVLAAFNGETVSNYNMPNIDATGAVTNGQFKTPANAAFVQFNVIFSESDSADSVMLTDVGDTYNSAYVVPDYQPYGSSTKVKPSAIDCDDTPVEDSEKPITSGGVYEALQGIAPQAESNKKLKVLLIGSSHGVNTISMFPALCKGAGIDIVCGNLYTASATLGKTPNVVPPTSQIPYKARFGTDFTRFAIYQEGEWSNEATNTMQYALTNYKWDAIIVQRGNTEVEYWNTELDSYLQYLLDYIKDNCTINGIPYTPKIYFNSGLANGSPRPLDDRTNQIDVTGNIIDTAEVMKSHFGIDVIPVAVALQYARATCLVDVGAWNPQDKQAYQEHPTWTKPDLTYDGQHLDTGVGQYILACCVFEKIVKDFFNMSVRELDYIPVYSDISGNTTNDTEAYFTPITEYYSKIGKTCAALACIDGEYKADTATYLGNKFDAEPVQCNITYNLTNCSLNDTRTTIMSDDVYMANFTPNAGYTLDTSTVNVMMNGVDVTSDVFVYKDSVFGIRIGEITGDIVITATAQQS